MSWLSDLGGTGPLLPINQCQGRQLSRQHSANTSAHRKAHGPGVAWVAERSHRSCARSIDRKGWRTRSMRWTAGAGAKRSLTPNVTLAARRHLSRPAAPPYQQDRMGPRRSCRGTPLSFDPCCTCCVRRLHPRHRSSRRLGTWPADWRLMVESTRLQRPPARHRRPRSFMFCSARSGGSRSAPLITT